MHSKVELIPQKGKERAKSRQGSALFQRQVPEIPIISEPKLEISISDSNRFKSHSEGSDRHLNEAVQEVLHSVQGKGLGNVATNPPRSDKLLEHPQNVSQRGGNSEILQWM
ncbi:hypothetical protein O181_130352 [Austropuccinia psidii MF-1]|uniref:Uncharacterized protein n=1 Tax=Austropuccinia psidii MF-1 TaxID=1389203 RepID=A0A9Q3L109_9BASI|nr:hypothetical protein [Austropuccinia psidii MF-1]